MGNDDEIKDLLREMRDLALRAEKRAEAMQAEVRKMTASRMKIFFMAGAVVLMAFTLLLVLAWNMGPLLEKMRGIR